MRRCRHAYRVPGITKLSALGMTMDALTGRELHAQRLRALSRKPQVANTCWSLFKFLRWENRDAGWTSSGPGPGPPGSRGRGVGAYLQRNSRERSWQRVRGGLKPSDSLPRKHPRLQRGAAPGREHRNRGDRGPGLGAPGDVIARAGSSFWGSGRLPSRVAAAAGERR